MNLGRTVFSQLIEHLPSKEFHKCVLRYRGDSYLVSPAGDQFLSMAFAQLTYRESLRDINDARQTLPYGIVARSTLADANESRDWRIYADFAQVLIGMARPLLPTNRCGLGPNALDSTTIDLCLSLFPWGEIPQAQGRREDAQSTAPTFSAFCAKCMTSTSWMNFFPRPARSTSWIVMRFCLFVTLCSAFFSKRTFCCSVATPTRWIGARAWIRSHLDPLQLRPTYPDPLRRVSYFDAETNKRKFLLCRH